MRMNIGARKGLLLLDFYGLFFCVGGTIFLMYLLPRLFQNATLYGVGMACLVIPSHFLMIILGLKGVGTAFCTIWEESSTITLDETGVTNKTRFYEESLRWEDVREHGVIKKSFKFIYISGKRISKDKAWIMMERHERRVWYPNVVREKRNQKKKDFFLAFPYKKERWSYVCRMMDKQEEWRREYLEELQEGQGEFRE